MMLFSTTRDLFQEALNISHHSTPPLILLTEELLSLKTKKIKYGSY